MQDDFHLNIMVLCIGKTYRAMFTSNTRICISLHLIPNSFMPNTTTITTKWRNTETKTKNMKFVFLRVPLKQLNLIHIK